MTIKDFADIEPKQKNIIIIFCALFSVSFLQIFLFKRELMSENFFTLSVLSISLSFFWYLINSLSSIFFYLTLSSRKKAEKSEPKSYLTITFLGFIFLSWIYLLTFICYEYNMNFKTFIKLSAIVCVLRSIFWAIICYVRRIYLGRK